MRMMVGPTSSQPKNQSECRAIAGFKATPPALLGGSPTGV